MVAEALALNPIQVDLLLPHKTELYCMVCAHTTPDALPWLIFQRFGPPATITARQQLRMAKHYSSMHSMTDQFLSTYLTYMRWSTEQWRQYQTIAINRHGLILFVGMRIWSVGLLALDPRPTYPQEAYDQ